VDSFKLNDQFNDKLGFNLTINNDNFEEGKTIGNVKWGIKQNIHF